MLSFGPFSFGEYLSKYHFRFQQSSRWRLWTDFKLNIYEFLIYQSLIRLMLSLPYFTSTGSLSPDYRKIDPFVYAFTVEFYESNFNIVISLVFFTLYRLALFRQFRYNFPEFGQRKLFPDFRLLKNTLNFPFWGGSGKFDEAARLISVRIAPFMLIRDRMSLIKLVFRLNFAISRFAIGLFLLNIFMVVNFYLDFIRPKGLNLLSTIIFCIDFGNSIVYSFDIIRQSLFLATYAIYTISRFIWQMKSVTSGLLIQLKRTRIQPLRRAVYKAHFVHIYVLLGNIELNKKIVRGFYSKAVIINLITNVSIIAGLASHNYSPIMDTILKIIVAFQIVVISIVGQYFVASSSALVRPRNAVYEATIVSRKLAYREVQLYTRLMTFYEMVHHRRSFRYDFGALGRISRKSLLSFWGFYFGLILMAIKDHRLRN